MARRSLALPLAILAAVHFASFASAREDGAARPVRLHVLGGAVDTGGESSWAILASYEHELGDLLSLEVSYYNEGHPDPEPHRDGFAVQLFANARPFALVADPGPATAWLAERLRVRAGAGPSIDFNTVGASQQRPREQTDAGFKLTAAMDLLLVGGLAIGPRVEEHLGIDSHDALVVGLDVSWALFPAPERPRPDFGAVAATGKSTRNAQGGSGVPAYVAVARNGLFGADQLGASAAFLSLGGPNDRRGVAVDVGAEQRFLESGALAIGAGVGPYFYDDGERSGQDPSGVTALIRTVASYRVWRNWKLVAMFLREAGSPQQQNYDVFLGGVGVDFDLTRDAADDAEDHGAD